jgi:hypothetical protein
MRRDCKKSWHMRRSGRRAGAPILELEHGVCLNRGDQQQGGHGELDWSHGIGRMGLVAWVGLSSKKSEGLVEVCACCALLARNARRDALN